MSSKKKQKALLGIISGFPEMDTKKEIVMQRVMQQIKEVYQKFGFVPLDTRLVEPADILIQKGIDGKEVYCLGRLHDGEVDMGRKTQKKLALRFDLTVPLARFVGQNKKSIIFPLKRYQVQKVYRGEAAKMNSGRFREFYQSDIDVVGRGKVSFSYDSEFPAIIYLIFKQVIGIDNFKMRINNRKLLEGIFMEYGLEKTEMIKKAVKIIDNMEKVPEQETTQKLQEVGISKENASKILFLFRLLQQSDPEIAINSLLEIPFKNSLINLGISELKEVFDGIIANGVPKTHFILDPSIARGLDYYTGTVYETILPDSPELGSVCSGGRYSDLVSVITGNPNDHFPGVGISIGLSRLIPSLIQKGILKAEKDTVAPILVTVQDPKLLLKYQKIAAIIRNGGFNVDVYYQTKNKLGKQFNFADNKGYTYVIVANKDELESGKVNVRNMFSKQQSKLNINQLVTYFKENIKEEKVNLVIEEQNENQSTNLDMEKITSNRKIISQLFSISRKQVEVLSAKNSLTIH